MDAVIWLQALLNAWGVTLDARRFASQGIFTVNKGDVQRWWEQQTRNFQTAYYYLSIPCKMLLMVLGEDDFNELMKELSNKWKPSLPINERQQAFIDEFSSMLNTIEQNSVKNEVGDSVATITSRMALIGKDVAEQLKKPKIISTVKNKINEALNVNNVEWDINWEHFSDGLANFINTYSSSTYKYIHVVYFYMTGTPNTFGIGCYLSPNSTTTVEHYFVGPRYNFMSIQVYDRVNSTYVECPILWDGHIGKEKYVNIGYTKEWVEDFIYFDTIYTQQGYPDYTSNPPKAIHKQWVDLSTKEQISAYDFMASPREYAVIDLSTGSPSYVINKGADLGAKTVIGVANDTADENEDVVFITNPDKVETLANTTATDYPDVLPQTVGLELVDIGAQAGVVTDAINNIVDANPSYIRWSGGGTITTSGNNLFTVYKVTTSNLSDLADFLWTTFDFEHWQKWFSNPSESLISLCAYPITVFAPTAKNIKIGYVDTGIQANTVDSYIQNVEMGSILIPSCYGNFLDQNPYTKVSIYLPFIGTVPLDADIVIGKKISIKYRIELLTGNCAAIITVYRDTGTYPCYQFTGNCAMQLPLSSGTYAGIVKNIGYAVGSVAAAFATKGASVPFSAVNAGSAIAGMKTNVAMSGNMQGSAGMCGILTPYVIIERPLTDVPNNYAGMNGLVTNQYINIGSLSGYTVFESIDVNTVDCTDEEKMELLDILTTGFFV